MAIGPGKYDDLATLVREGADAQAVIVIVLGGSKGSGFSLQARAHDVATQESFVAAVPSILRNVADQIERDTE